MGTFVPFHCIPQLQPQGLKAIVAFCVLQGWETRRLAKAAAIHDTDGESDARDIILEPERRDQLAFSHAAEFSCHDFDLQVP